MVRHWPGGVPGIPGRGPAIKMTSLATASMGRQGRTDSAAARRACGPPGPHAAHIHLGSCMRQGPVKYMLRDLVAGPRGHVVHAVRTFRHVMAPIPAHGWYLNIHQGSSATILSNGQPTISFRPLLCANIH